MDVVFNCPNCTQELEVDEAAVGQQIECPSCANTITIPAGKPKPAAPPPPPLEAKPSAGDETKPAEAAPAAEPPPAPKRVPYTVPQHDKVEEILVKKTASAASAPKAQKKHLRTHTIRRNQCMEVGHDKFDEKVTEFLEKIGDENVVSITPITYGFVDTVGHMLNDYGVIIVYKG